MEVLYFKLLQTGDQKFLKMASLIGNIRKDRKNLEAYQALYNFIVQNGDAHAFTGLMIEIHPYLYEEDEHRVKRWLRDGKPHCTTKDSNGMTFAAEVSQFASAWYDHGVRHRFEISVANDEFKGRVAPAIISINADGVKTARWFYHGNEYSEKELAILLCEKQ